MRYLLYCIFRSSKHRGRQTLSGVGGRTVFLIARNGLTAAVSRIAHSDLTPDIPRILAYKKVIESFHRHHTVIPIRYGCLFEEESQIIRLFEERNQQYEALLKELDGCVEMGIRVLLEGKQHHNTSRFELGNSNLDMIAASHPGRAYLAARKACYAQEDRSAEEISAMIDRYRTAFAGLAVKFKTESPRFSSVSRTPLISLFFLVPRISVGAFREIFQHISCQEPAKILLSGPWPPYNFVLPAAVPHQDILMWSKC